jgi:hypothetical protein
MICRDRGGGRRGADRRAGKGRGGQRCPRRLHQLGNLVLPNLLMHSRTTTLLLDPDTVCLCTNA